jgi:hypothetical protein
VPRKWNNMEEVTGLKGVSCIISTMEKGEYKMGKIEIVRKVSMRAFARILIEKRMINIHYMKER